MIIKKCRKCGLLFPDFSMFGQETVCDACSLEFSKVWVGEKKNDNIKSW